VENTLLFCGYFGKIIWCGKMTEPLHKIVKYYLHHSDADDLCNDITGWLQRNYDDYKDRPVIDKICEDIWKSCDEADKG
jgi:hypothetical protein